MGLYATPLKANGINAGMIRALKITADKIALSGLCNFIIFIPCNAGMDAINNAGTIDTTFGVNGISKYRFDYFGTTSPEYPSDSKLYSRRD